MGLDDEVVWKSYMGYRHPSHQNNVLASHYETLLKNSLSCYSTLFYISSGLSGKVKGRASRHNICNCSKHKFFFYVVRFANSSGK